MKKFAVVTFLFITYLGFWIHQAVASECFDGDCTVTPINDAEKNEMEFDDYGSNSPPASSSPSAKEWGCASGEIDNVADCLGKYKPKNTLSVGDGTLSGGNDGVKGKVIAIANRIISVVALMAIAAIVFAGFHMVTAYGDDEKHKKGKEALKWGIIGFATALLSFGLVNALVNFFYNIGW